MSPESLASLEDIRQAISLIKQAVAGLTLVDYLSNWEKQSAVERQFILIGESLVRIRNKEPDLLIQIDRSRDIINFRNLLVHSYDTADPERVFALSAGPVDRLLSDVMALLGPSI